MTLKLYSTVQACINLLFSLKQHTQYLQFNSNTGGKKRGQ